MTAYLTGSEILAAGSRACKFQVVVGENAQFEANVLRPSSTAFGTDAFPTLWDKAAAILHSFATTQTLLDGNKRTAWAAAWMFLIVNGAAPLWITTILDVDEAESLVMAVADGELDVPETAIRLRQLLPA